MHSKRMLCNLACLMSFLCALIIVVFIAGKIVNIFLLKVFEDRSCH